MRFDTLKTKKLGADYLTFEGGLGDLICVRFFSQTSGDRFFFPDIQSHRPLPSSKSPYFQNEAKYSTFLVEMSFICLRMKSHFHIKGCALNLVWYRGPEELGNGLLYGRYFLARFFFVRNQLVGYFFLKLPYPPPPPPLIKSQMVGPLAWY